MIAPLIQRIKGSDFTKDSLTLGLGTLISGLIPVFGAVVLMKLYSPEAYGQLSVFISYYFVISTFSTGRYEQSIILPESWQDGARLTWVAIGASFLVNALVFLILIALPRSILDSLGLNVLGNYAYLIPLCSFLYAASQSMFYYANREKKYKTMALGKIANNTSQVGFQIGFAFAKVSFSGLIVGRILGRLVGVMAYLKSCSDIFKSEVFNQDQFKLVIGRYASFPKHLSLSYLFSSLFQQIPVLFVSAHFGAFYAGQLALATQIIAAPNALLATAFGDVFRRQAVDQMRVSGRFDALYRKIGVVLGAVAILPFLVMTFLAKSAFEFYDEDWTLAGTYVQYLAPGLFFMFLVNPLSSAALVREKTRFILIWNFSMFASFVIISLITSYIGFDVSFYLIVLTAVRSIHYIVEWWYCYRFSKGL